MRPSAGLIVAVAVALSACGDMPRPFDHTGDAFGQGRSRILTRLATAEAVTVVPPAGLDGATATEVAASMVHALHQQETPARIGEDGGGYRLMAERQGDTLFWSLIEPDGAVISTHRQPWPDAPVASVAAALVPALDADRDRPLEQRMKVGAGPAPVQRPADSRPVRVVVEVASAQHRVLKTAMESALQQHRLVLTQDAAAPAVEVRGVLTIGAPQGGGPDPVVPVAVIWTVTDATGAAVGTARQENPVPKRLVDSSFPMLAVAIAQAGSGGISDVLDRVPGVQRRGSALP